MTLPVLVVAGDWIATSGTGGAACPTAGCSRNASSCASLRNDSTSRLRSSSPAQTGCEVCGARLRILLERVFEDALDLLPALGRHRLAGHATFTAGS